MVRYGDTPYETIGVAAAQVKDFVLEGNRMPHAKVCIVESILMCIGKFAKIDFKNRVYDCMSSFVALLISC